jgi:drug/metabolite transporter (DMT)-like permease
VDHSAVTVITSSRIFSYECLRRIGVLQTQAVIGTSPFFVTLFETFFLREGLSLNFWFSSILIMLSILILSLKEGMSIKLTLDLLFPLLVSISLALRQILRRFGLKIHIDIKTLWQKRYFI